ncbi:MAG TPA: metallophosphoesterase [Candidatus Polarisedimenticolia bacterium]|nr:metallophosphoesterase [Candidatus Polarisedimenticolia bacterium]
MFRSRFRLALAGLALVGLLCAADGWLVEPYWPQVTHVRVFSPRLRPGTTPIRVVLLSDMHSDPKPRLEERLPDLVAAQHPDLIVYTGDSINTPRAAPVFRSCMTRLARVAPTFAVRGNWDAWYWHGVDLFGGTGVRDLDGDSGRVEVRGTSVWVGGVSVRHEDRVPAVLAGIPEDGGPALFLYHYPYPDVLPDGQRDRIDLLCSGHTHGGQVALPFYGAIITFSKYGKRYEAGLYSIGASHMYVNRGIGLEGGIAPRVRFFARPEITVVELTPEPEGERRALGNQ